MTRKDSIPVTMPTTRPQSTDVRFPLIVVDWARDRHRYESGWLQLAGPADLPQLQQNSTTQIWDGHGRPVTVHGTAVTMTTTATDPAVRNILSLWRSRVPLPDHAEFDVGRHCGAVPGRRRLAARTKLTQAGTTRRPGTALRLLPILLMLLSAAAIFPLMRSDPLNAAIAFIGYAAAPRSWFAGVTRVRTGAIRPGATRTTRSAAWRWARRSFSGLWRPLR